MDLLLSQKKTVHYRIWVLEWPRSLVFCLLKAMFYSNMANVCANHFPFCLRWSHSLAQKSNLNMTYTVTNTAINMSHKVHTLVFWVMAPYSVLVSWLSLFQRNKLKVTLNTTLLNFIITNTSNLNIPNHSTTHVSASEFLSILLCTLIVCPGIAWTTQWLPQPCVPPVII